MKKVLLIITYILIHLCVKASPSIQNIDFKFNGKQLIISYDIKNSTEKDTFNISISILKEGGEKINARAFSGDVGTNVSGGDKKNIIWNVRADNPSISSNIYIVFDVTEKLNINKLIHLSKSVLMPGLGNYRLDNKKLHFLYGLTAYGALGGGILMGQSAYSNYQSYLGANTASSANTYFNNASSLQTQSAILLGTSAAIWTFSMVNTYIKIKRLQKLKEITKEDSKFYFAKSIEKKQYKSETKFFEIKEEFFPPNLALDIDHEVKFLDETRQEIFFLEADRKGYISLKLKNSGQGNALKVSIILTEKSGIKGLKIPSELAIGKIEKGTTKNIEIPFETNIFLTNGMATLNFDITEQNDFGPLPFEKQVECKKFLEPNLQAMDYKISSEKGGIPEKNEKIFLEVLIQNIGFGDAKNINIEFTNSDPNLVMNLSENSSFSYVNLAAGKAINLNQIFLVKPKYTDTIVRVSLKISEKYGRYAQNKEIFISLKNELPKKLNVYSNTYTQAEIRPLTLSSDIDINIPYNPEINPNKFALVIGNEDYKSKQANLGIESNVDFALNDAKIFTEYLNKSLGYRSDNIKHLSNATAGEMKTEIYRLAAMISKLSDPSKTEIIFYYAGHGYPDPITQIPYIMPVDVSVDNLNLAIRVNELFETLSKTNAGKITVFLDACFTGGGRTEGLLAARSARIKPQSNALSGNMVVFNASSGTQTALPYKEQKHGYFTYYLLKKIQETKGEITYAELEKYLKEKVSFETTKAIRPQDPEVNASEDLKDAWKKWKLK